MGNKVLFGLEQVHIAFIDEAATEQPAWEAPIPIPGAVNFSASPEGDENTFYADNSIYYVHNSNNGYTGELEVALIPDEVLADMLGLSVDANGMLVETADGVGKEFALMGQVQGDQRNRRFVYYRCKAARPSQENSTTENSISPTTQTVSLTMLPIEADGEKIIKGVMELNDTNQAAYDAFFTTVATPAPVAGV